MFNKKKKGSLVLWLKGGCRKWKQKSEEEGGAEKVKEGEKEFLCWVCFFSFFFCVSSHILILIEETRCIHDTLSMINILISFIILNEIILSNFNYV